MSIPAMRLARVAEDVFVLQLLDWTAARRKAEHMGSESARLMEAQGFGFVVLFNGRESRALKSLPTRRQKGTADGATAAKSAEREGFAKGTVIFLDIEEGGRLPASYHEYLKSWRDGIASAGYRGGSVLLGDSGE